jgi:hypothetical protein
MADKQSSGKNLAQWDRTLRGVAGFMLLGYWGAAGFPNFWMPIIGGALLANAAMGQCGLYRMLGISTCPVKLKAPPAPGKPASGGKTSSASGGKTSKK